MNLTVYITVYYNDDCMYAMQSVSSLGKLFKKSSESLVTKGSSAHVQVAIVCVLSLMGRALGCLPPEK